MIKEHMVMVKDPHGHEQGRIIFIKRRHVGNFLIYLREHWDLLRSDCKVM